MAVRAGRAGGDDGVVRTAQLVADRDMAGGEIDEATGNEEGRQAARTLVAQRVAAFDDAIEAADAGADENTGGALVVIRLRMPVGIGQRHFGSGNGIDDIGIDLALLLGLHPLVDIVGAVGAVADRNAAGDLGGQVFHFEFGNAAGAVSTGQQALPCDFRATTKGDTMPVPVMTTRLIVSVPPLPCCRTGADTAAHAAGALPSRPCRCRRKRAGPSTLELRFLSTANKARQARLFDFSLKKFRRSVS